MMESELVEIGGYDSEDNLVLKRKINTINTTKTNKLLSNNNLNFDVTKINENLNKNYNKNIKIDNNLNENKTQSQNKTQNHIMDLSLENYEKIIENETNFEILNLNEEQLKLKLNSLVEEANIKMKEEIKLNKQKFSHLDFKLEFSDMIMKTSERRIKNKSKLKLNKEINKINKINLKNENEIVYFAIICGENLILKSTQRTKSNPYTGKYIVNTRFNIPDKDKNNESYNIYMSRKFVCEICSKRFRRNGGLKDHMNLHNDVRRYGCNQCGKRFVQKSNLKKHFLSKNCSSSNNHKIVYY